MEDVSNRDGIENAISSARQIISDLYLFRDNYFETHDISSAINKNNDLKQELATVKKSLEDLEKTNTELTENADFLMLKGKAFNICPEYSSATEQYLSRSIKLNPNLVDAWIELGECFWKKNDIKSSKDCFMGALNHDSNKVALRNLSMVLRQSGTEVSEKKQNIKDSVEKAKKAVELDITDGVSWVILGNAYLSLFFSDIQNPDTLKNSLSAYQQAEKYVISRTNPDLHYNRATLYKFLEKYNLALHGYQFSSRLDPLWEEPSEQKSTLLSYLETCQNLIQLKGKIGKKRLKSLIDSLKIEDKNDSSNKLSTIPINKLEPGVNKDVQISAKIICLINNADTLPVTFFIVDQNEVCVSVTVYNLAKENGIKIGDTLTILSPNFIHVDFQFDHKTFDFKNIRVERPSFLLINGKRPSSTIERAPVISVNKIDE